MRNIAFNTDTYCSLIKMGETNIDTDSVYPINDFDEFQQYLTRAGKFITFVVRINYRLLQNYEL